jgi:hypothetical protein
MSPGANGGAGWSPVAYSPQNGIAYVLGIHQPMVYTRAYQPQEDGRLRLGGSFLHVPEEEQWGTLSAINIQNGRIEWQHRVPKPMLGAALANAAGIVGGGMHIAMHAFGKITLFFCAGAIYVAAKKTEISDMDGIGRRMPVTLFAFFIGALSVTGLPPLGGSWSKWYIMLGAMDNGQLVLVGALALSTLLNIAYLMPVVVRGFLLPPKDGYTGGIKEAPLACVVPLSLTALFCFLLFVYVGPLAALWIGRPLDFKYFPTIMLIATMLRLSLNIATTSAARLAPTRPAPSMRARASLGSAGTPAITRPRGVALPARSRVPRRAADVSCFIGRPIIPVAAAFL